MGDDLTFNPMRRLSGTFVLQIACGTHCIVASVFYTDQTVRVSDLGALTTVTENQVPRAVGCPWPFLWGFRTHPRPNVNWVFRRMMLLTTFNDESACRDTWAMQK